MRTLLLGLLLLGGFGCTNLQPIGPMAKHKAKPPVADTELDPDIPPPPTSTVQKPVPPAMRIEPGEVNSATAAASVQKLTNEFEYDWKTLPPPPRTAEVSRYKNGVKVN